MLPTLRALALAMALFAIAPAAAHAVVDDAPTGNYTLGGTPGNDTITIDDGVTGDGRIRVTVNATPEIEFKNKTNVTIDGGAGTDTIQVNNSETADGLSRLTVASGDATDSVALGQANYSGATFVIDGGGDVDDINGTATNVTANAFGTRVSGEVGSLTEPIQIAVANLEVTSGEGQHLLARSAVTVGNVPGNNPTTGAAEPELNGLEDTGTGRIGLVAQGILLDDVSGVATVYATGGDIALVSTDPAQDLRSAVDYDAARADGGDVLLSSGRDILLGTAGPDFTNDVEAHGLASLDAERDITLEGTSRVLARGNGSTDDLILESGRNVSVLEFGSLSATGPAGENVGITTGPGGIFTLDVPFINTVFSAQGSIFVAADRAIIDPASGFTADNGEVSIGPATIGRPVDLGSTTDAATDRLEVSDAEVDRAKAPTVRIGDDNPLTVTAPIGAANADTLTAASDGTMAATGAGALDDTTVRFTHADSTGADWRVTPAAVEGVPYTASNLVIDGSFGNDRFFVRASPTTPYLIDGNPPNSPGADSLHYDDEGRTTGGDKTAPDGQITSPGRAPVDFEEMEDIFVATDLDSDLFVGAGDNCQSVPNGGQGNNDGDAQGDPCDADDDNDGLTDAAEARARSNPLVADTDGDGRRDSADNCVLRANASQADADRDRLGDACDPTPFPAPPVVPVTPAAATLRASHRRVRLRRGRIRFILRCEGDSAATPCKGRYSVRATGLRRRPRASGAARGRAFDIAPGGRQAFLAAVPSASKRQLRRRGRAVVYLQIVLEKPGGGTTRSRVAFTLVP